MTLLPSCLTKLQNAAGPVRTDESHHPCFLQPEHLEIPPLIRPELGNGCPPAADASQPVGVRARGDHPTAVVQGSSHVLLRQAEGVPF